MESWIFSHFFKKLYLDQRSEPEKKTDFWIGFQNIFFLDSQVWIRKFQNRNPKTKKSEILTRKSKYENPKFLNPNPSRKPVFFRVRITDSDRNLISTKWTLFDRNGRFKKFQIIFFLISISIPEWNCTF